MTRPRSPRRTLLSAAPASARTLTPAESQRWYRHGHRAPRPGEPTLRWSQARNGLPPFKPYVWRGER
jgi:hypothetical protein